MKGTISCLLFVGCAIMAGAGRAGAQAPAGAPASAIHMHHHTPPPAAATGAGFGVPENNLSVGMQYYEADPEGLREYLDTIRSSKPELYRQLDGDVSALERDDTIGTVLMWGGPILGIGVAVAGILVTANRQCDEGLSPGDPGWSEAVDRELDCESEKGTQMLIFCLAGTGTAILGLGIGWIVVAPN